MHLNICGLGMYLEVLSNLPNETLERKFPNQETGGFLIAPYLAEGNGAWPEPVRFFDTPLCPGLDGEVISRPSRRSNELCLTSLLAPALAASWVRGVFPVGK